MAGWDGIAFGNRSRSDVWKAHHACINRLYRDARWLIASCDSTLVVVKLNHSGCFHVCGA